MLGLAPVLVTNRGRWLGWAALWAGQRTADGVRSMSHKAQPVSHFLVGEFNGFLVSFPRRGDWEQRGRGDGLCMACDAPQGWQGPEIKQCPTARGCDDLLRRTGNAVDRPQCVSTNCQALAKRLGM